MKHPGDDDGPPSAPAPFEEQRCSREEKRDEEDEVALERQVREDGREVGGLDGRIDAEAHHGDDRHEGERKGAWSSGLVLWSYDGGETRHEGHDPEPDREGTGRPEAEVEHPTLVEGRGDVPGLGSMGDVRAAGEEHTDREGRPLPTQSPASTRV